MFLNEVVIDPCHALFQGAYDRAPDNPVTLVTGCGSHKYEMALGDSDIDVALVYASGRKQREVGVVLPARNPVHL